MLLEKTEPAAAILDLVLFDASVFDIVNNANNKHNLESKMNKYVFVILNST